MASLDSLPSDQRAVLELVLQRGRSYDEIARMLAIDRAGVRQRALAAFDALGPQTRLDPVRRALITDYLLGQLPARIAEETRASLGRSPTERAWARVVSSELSSLARDPLPEIPVQDPARESASATAEPAPAAAAASASAGSSPAGDTGAPARRSSRLGGALLLGLGALVVIAVVLVLLLTGGSSKKHSSSTAARPGSTASTPAGTTSTTAGHVIAQVNLLPPSGGNAKGIAQIVTVNNTMGVVIVATGVPANSHNAYAVWLSNSASSSKLVGFVSPGVTSNGQLQTEGPLPTNAASYTQLLVTLETQSHPTSPGPVILKGALKIP